MVSHVLSFGLLLLVSTFASVEKRNVVCYLQYGCFYGDDKLKTPQTPSVVNTHFRLFQRSQSSQVAETKGNCTSIAPSSRYLDILRRIFEHSFFDWAGGFLDSDLASFTQHVNATKKTKVLIHGFLDNGGSEWITKAKDELLIKARKLRTIK
jgi:hypothetical protein